MRSFLDDMENDPTSSRNHDREPTEDVIEDMNDMEDYGANFFEEDAFDENSDFQTQEFSALNNQLDQLQSALDMLESRNADIHQELLQLLQSNREVRRVIVEEMESASQETAPNSNILDSDSCPIPDASTSSVTITEIAEITTVPSTSSSSTTTTAEEKVVPSSPSTAAAAASLIHCIDAIKLEKCPN